MQHMPKHLSAMPHVLDLTLVHWYFSSWEKVLCNFCTKLQKRLWLRQIAHRKKRCQPQKELSIANPMSLLHWDPGKIQLWMCSLLGPSAWLCLVINGDYFMSQRKGRWIAHRFVTKQTRENPSHQLNRRASVRRIKYHRIGESRHKYWDQ